MWPELLKQIETQIGPDVLQNWFSNVSAEHISAQEIVLKVPNQFYLSKINSNFLPHIQEAAQNIFGTQVPVSILVNQMAQKAPEAAPATAANPAPAVATQAPTQNSSQFNPKYSFNHYVVGPHNSFAHAVSMAVSESPGTAYNPLFLYSKVGLGKTHLMQAIALAIQEKHPNFLINYVSSEKFTNELISSLQNQKIEEFRSKYRNSDVLLIDDIQFIAGKERTQEEFFHTFNHLYNDNKQIILSSDRPPKEIEDLKERLISRFEWGITADMQTPDFETRMAILQKKAETMPQPVPYDVLEFIAQSFKSNVRELEGALIRLLALSALNEQELSVDLAQKELKELIHTIPQKITAEAIQNVVCEHFGISSEQLKSSRRMKSLVVPRQIAMFLVRDLTEFSYPEIGEHFGGKDHSTIIHACDKIGGQLSKDSQLQSTLEQLKEKICG